MQLPKSPGQGMFGTEFAGQSKQLRIGDGTGTGIGTGDTGSGIGGVTGIGGVGAGG